MVTGAASGGDWRDAAETAFGMPFSALTRIGGGDFAESFRATLEDGRAVFVKTHNDPPPHFFTTEGQGLHWLHETHSVAIPQVLFVSDSPPCLVMEWVEIGGAVKGTEQTLGRALAALHSAEWPCFGRPDERTTGSLALPNRPADSWSDFYANRRLLPLARIAHERGVLDRARIASLERLAGRLDRLGVPDEGPSLLHGDLWAGNRVVDRKGQSWLIDPAAHGGHREFDIAMMHLFGGFGNACFAAYDEATPLAPGWPDRILLHQLAPLLVHAIKFGGHYIAATREAIEHYVQRR